MNFLMKRVNIFKEASREKFFTLVLYTIKSQYPEGREWDVCKEKYIYFIINGENSKYPSCHHLFSHSPYLLDLQ